MIKPTTHGRQTWGSTLTAATGLLRTRSPSPDIDAQRLLCAVLDVELSALYRRADETLKTPQKQAFQALLNRRLCGEPVAYILGYQGFWTLDLTVTPDVLIPRPETELLVELALEKLPADQACRVVDLGTGSGAIACALASERPNWTIIATDISRAALKVAHSNVQRHQLNNIQFAQGSWCDALPNGEQWDAIISNPPYIAQDDPHLKQGDLVFEPMGALASGERGMQDIYHIIRQAKAHLVEGGLLMFEQGYEQSALAKLALAQYGYGEVDSAKDLAGIERASLGRRA